MNFHALDYSFLVAAFDLLSAETFTMIEVEDFKKLKFMKNR